MKTAIFSLILVISIVLSGNAAAKHGLSTKTINLVTKELGEKPDILVTINIKNFKSSYFYGKLLPVATTQAQKDKEMCADKINMKGIDYALVTGRVKRPGVKEAVVGVISGTFNSTVFLDCVAKRNNLIAYKKDGVNGYREKNRSNYAFAVGPGSILMIQGDYIKKIKLKKGYLGTGTISSLVSKHAASVKIDRLEKGSEIKSLSGRIDVNTDIKVAGNCIWSSLNDRNKFDKDIKKLQANLIISAYLTGLKYTFNGTRMDLTFTFNKKQFDSLLLLSKAFLNKK